MRMATNTWVRIFSATAVAIMMTACCDNRHASSPQAQFLTAEDNGAFWLAGSEHFAMHFDGKKFEKRDYPTHNDAPDWAYESSTDIPTSSVINIRGTSYLFLRVGYVYRWQSRWELVPIKYPNERDHLVNGVWQDSKQNIVIQIHATSLLWTTPEKLLRSEFREETTPTFFTWLQMFDDVLYGIGWDSTGNTRAAYRRESDGKWTMLANFPKEKRMNNPVSLFVWKKHGIGFVFSDGVIWYRDGKVVEPKQSIAELFGSHAKTLAPVGSTYLKGSLNLPHHGPLLKINGNKLGVLELGDSIRLWWEVSHEHGYQDILGALEINNGIRVVTAKPSAFDLTTFLEIPVHAKPVSEVAE
jgi:hypothetical protein